MLAAGAPALSGVSTSYGPSPQASNSSRSRRQQPRPCAAQSWVWRGTRRVPARRRALLVHAALFDPPPFDPSKLSVQYLADALPATLSTPRCYTLTHNDLTGSLTLSIGPHYNRQQLSGWYTRILRDEVLAQWQHGTAVPSSAASAWDGDWPSAGGGPVGAGSSSNSSNCSSNSSSAGSNAGSTAGLSLHVYCHVSGEEMWPAPPRLRSFIFQREMGLVLDTITHAEAGLLAAHPQLAAAPVVVHLRSDISELNRVVEWGQLGARASWLRSSDSMLGSLFGGGSGSWSLLSSVFGSMSSSMDESDGDGDGGLAALQPAQPAQQQQQQSSAGDDSIEPLASSSSSNSSSGVTAATANGAVSARGIGGASSRSLSMKSLSLSAAARQRVAAAAELGSSRGWAASADLEGLPSLPAVEAVLVEPPAQK